MVDFSGFINAAKAAISSAASMQVKTNKVDTDPETNALKAMLSGINKTAASQDAGLDTVEFTNLVAQEKSALTPFVDDAQILAELMGALSEVEPNIDMAKVDKYNKEHPTLTSDTEIAQTIMNSTDDGYVGMDAESFNTIAAALGDSADKVLKYMSNAINDGSAGGIMQRVQADEARYEGDKRLMEAMKASDNGYLA